MLDNRARGALGLVNIQHDDDADDALMHRVSSSARLLRLKLNIQACEPTTVPPINGLSGKSDGFFRWLSSAASPATALPIVRRQSGVQVIGGGSS